jgi:O-antigen/teichoic acid export membrane protein
LAYELSSGNALNLKRLFAMAINVHLLLALMLFILLELGGVWFLNNHLNISPERLYAANWCFQFSLFCFIIEIIKMPYHSLIVVHEHMNFYTYLSVIEISMKLGVVFLLQIVSLDRLILYSLLLFGVALITFICYYCYCYMNFPESRYEYYWDKMILSRLTSYSGWSLLGTVANVSVMQSNNIFLNWFGGVSANAAMGVANGVNSQLNGFLDSFSSSYNPQIIKSYAKNDKKYFMQLLFSTSKTSYFLLFSASFPLMINLDYILTIWLGTPPPMTTTFLCLILIYSLINSYSYPLWLSVHATGKLRIHQILMFSFTILNIPISYIFLRMGYPLSTVLIVYVLLNAIFSFVRIIYLKRLINLPLIKYFKDVLGRILLVTLLSAPFPLVYNYNSISCGSTFILSLLLFFILYFPLVYYIGFNSKERNLVYNMVRSKLKFKGV